MPSSVGVGDGEDVVDIDAVWSRPRVASRRTASTRTPSSVGVGVIVVIVVITDADARFARVASRRAAHAMVWRLGVTMLRAPIVVSRAASVRRERRARVHAQAAAPDVRWRVVRRRCEAVLRARGVDGDVNAILRKALRPTWDAVADDDVASVTNGERAAIATCVLGSEVWRTRLERERACVRAGGWREASEALDACGGGEDAREIVLMYWCGKERLGAREGTMPDDGALVEMYGERVRALVEAVKEENLTWTNEISEKFSLPTRLADMFVDEYGADEAGKLAQAMNTRGPVVCRVNAARGASKADVIEMLKAEGVGDIEDAFAHLVPGAFWLKDGAPANGGIYGSKTWVDGFYEVQDEGSQLIAASVDAAPGDVVLDACAGNGGKTLALASSMLGVGKIYAFDVDKRRLKHLLANIERAQVGNIVEVLEKIGSLDELPAAAFDAVLVDAPCSSVGALRRTPSLRYTHDDPYELAKIQLEILRRASRLVKPNGGRLIYATCSVVSIENQDVARAFEAHHADFAPWPFETPVPTSPNVALHEHERLLLPHVLGTDGFYISRWKRD